MQILKAQISIRSRLFNNWLQLLYSFRNVINGDQINNRIIITKMQIARTDEASSVRKYIENELN